MSAANGRNLDALVRQSVRCTKCGAGYGKCDCWTECRCGWLYERGGQCQNPVHKTGVFTSESEPNAEPGGLSAEAKW